MTRPLKPRRVAALALLVAVMALTACGSNSNENTNYAAVEPAPAFNTTADNTPTVSEPVAAAVSAARPASAETTEAVSAASGTPVDNIADVTALFDEFLQLRSQAITNEVTLDALEDVATSAAIAQVLADRAANDERLAAGSFAASEQLAAYSNITTAFDTGNGLAFTDCTEQHRVTPGGTTVVRFVTNNVSMINDDGALKVDDVTTIHDGVIASSAEDFGCVPTSFAERAIATAEDAVWQANSLITDPEQALNEPLPAVYRDSARSDLERVLQTLMAEGLSRRADELIQYRVIGMDVHQPEFTVVVAVCRLYANGRTFIDASGESTVTDVPNGATNEEWLHVQLEPVAPGSETGDAVIALEDRRTSCQGS